MTGVPGALLARARADDLFHRRHDRTIVDPAHLPALGSGAEARSLPDRRRRPSAARSCRGLSARGLLHQGGPAVARRAGDDAQDRSVRGLPRSLRRGGSARKLDGRIELPLQGRGALVASAKDPISAGLALEAFLPAGHFARTGAELFSMGAGGSTIAITWYLTQPERGDDRPSRVVVSNRSPARLNSLRRINDDARLRRADRIRARADA